MPRLIELLKRFDERYPHRARGGLYALAGFDFQLRAYLADFVQRLAVGNDIFGAGEEFLEAFSDFTREGGGEKVCVQAKRTLNAASMARAALEFVIIDEFLEEEAPDLQNLVSFEVVSQFSDLVSPSTASWDEVELPSDTENRDTRQARLEALRSAGRLLAPRIEPDPWWRLIAAVFPALDDPFAFAREALEVCVGRGMQPVDAPRVRDQIVEAFTKRRRNVPTFPGEVMTQDKFEADAITSREVILGEIPTVAHLRDGRFMARPERLAGAVDALDRHLAEREWRHEPQIYAFWIDGRSGNGKSVLLLELMRELVTNRGASVVWLDDASAGLFPLLEAWASSPEMSAGPWFVFVDDFNAPHKRDSIDFDAIARLLRRHPEIDWPILVTCGAPEQHEELKSSGHDEVLRVATWRLPPVDTTERDELMVWFENRTGEAPKTGSAFEQPEGLMISMVFEMRQGDLRRFGQRFRNRLEGEGLVEPLALPLSLSRLYVWAPKSWLSREQDDALRRINRDRDFSVLSPEERFGGYVRLTHPHLSDAIYQAIRAGGDEIVLARDLANAFAKALETDHTVARRVLRRVAESHERLEILDPAELAREMTAAWTSREAIETKFARDELASIWTYWACWAARRPEIVTLLGGASPLECARAALAADHQYWGVIWSHLWECQPGHPGLEADALGWLEAKCEERNRQWSRVWEGVLQFRRAGQVAVGDDLLRLAVRWLEANEFEPDWNYVFRPLANVSPDLAPWDSALRLVDQLPTNRNWAYVFQLLADARSRFSEERRGETTAAAWRWLAIPEAKETAEWTFVWRKLLECRDDLPEGVTVSELVQVGLEWLRGREERDDWAFVWQKLLECRDDLPEGVTVGELARAGLEWLRGREERAEWTFVWRKLLECRDDLPEGVTVSELVQVGLEWLRGREERDGWAFVWQKLLECRDDLPKDVTVSELVQVGLEWLEGREDRAEWTFVWEKLLKCRDDLPEGVTTSELARAGVEWLKGRDDREEWAFVWRKLLECGADLPEGVTASELARAGVEWLEGREDRAEWTFVWQKLLERREDLPGGATVSELLQRAWAWLAAAGNRSRGEWDKIYEACLQSGLKEPEFLQAGVEWVISNESQPQTYGIAEGILRALSRPTESHPLVSWATKWLAAHRNHPSWTYVWEALWLACPTVSTAQLVLPWIESGAKAGAIFYVARTMAETGRQEIIDLVSQWCTTNPEAPWVPAVQDGLRKGMRELGVRDHAARPGAEPPF